MIPTPYVVGGLALAGVAVLDRLAERVVRPARSRPEREPSDLGVEHEDVSIRSGGHELAAVLLTAGPDACTKRAVVLFAHGWGASYETVLDLAGRIAGRGHHALLFDVRGHGRNARLPYVTVRHFRDDLMAAVAYASERFARRRIVVVGHSMGGAAGVLAAAEGAVIDGLVLIAAPADVLEVTAEFLTDHGMPGAVMVRLLRPFWWRRLRGTFRRLTPSRRIAEVEVPILMLQPENDGRVSRRHADRLAAEGRLRYHLIEGREHTNVLAAPETGRLIEDFLEAL